MTSTPIVDIHAHYFPDVYLTALETEGSAHGFRLNRADPRGVAIDIHGAPGGPLRPAFHDLDLRRKEMDRQGVDVQALSLTHPMPYWGDGALGLRVSRLVNDALVEAHRAFPDRFVGLATLPLQDPARSLEELDRVAALPGIRGVYLGTNVNGRDLAHPDLIPVWARMEALGLPVLLHPINPIGPIGKERTDPYFLRALLGFPFDTTIAAAHLVFGGILDRFPRLVVGLAHAGGALPYLIGRLDRGYKVRTECDHIRRAPSAYLRRFLYDTITHAPDALRYLIDRVGAGRVMLGSDYCFDMGYPRPVEVVTRLTGVSRADKARFLGTTASRLLRL